MIQIENVSFQYNTSEKGALKDVSISVDKGECVLLCGASGCGKTTITRLINGLIPHFYEGEYSGNVSVYGMNVQREELYNISVFLHGYNKRSCVWMRKYGTCRKRY